MGLNLRSQPRGLGKSAQGQQLAQPGKFPAPFAGVNIFDSLAQMQPNDAIYSYNMIPSEYGFRTRQGYQQWVTGLTGTEVRELIPFNGETSAGDRLFATTKSGIFNVTASAAAPAVLIAWPSATADAGFGVYASYTNDGGDKFLFFADELNGLYEYNPATTTWSLVTSITGINEVDIRHITVHKTRIWLAVKDSSDAYYLPVGAKTGAVTKFALGNKFPRGGNIRGIYHWSVNGGNGIDDFLVFVSTSGDVAVYQGTDPASAATWQSLGVWNIGMCPYSRNIGQVIGGELHLLSVYGLISMQDLLAGVEVAKETGANALARKITKAIRNDMSSRTAYFNWNIITSMSQGEVVICRPIIGSETPIQYVFHFTTAAWGYWRGIPMSAGAEYNGAFYVGDPSGNVHKMQNSLDGVLRAGTGGTAIPFSFLTAYQACGAPGLRKRVDFIRPNFFSENGAAPTFGAVAQYDYNIAEIVQVLGGVGSAAGVWDTGLWDVAVWGGDSVIASRLQAGTGWGFMVALAVQGTAIDRTIFLDADVTFEVGGFLG